MPFLLLESLDGLFARSAKKPLPQLIAITVSGVVADQRRNAERARARALAVGALGGPALVPQPYEVSCFSSAAVMLYRWWLIRHGRLSFVTAFAGSLASYVVRIWAWRRAWDRR